MPMSAPRTHKHHGSGHTKHKSHGKGQSATSSSKSSYSLSFLFIVNEWVIDYDLFPATRDEWGNTVPPDYRTFVHEIPSKVMRYRDGRVTEADDYYFGRHPTHPREPKAEGGLYPRMPESSLWPEPYKSCTIFSCNPLLPIVVTRGDSSTYGDVHYEPLQFFHPMPGTPQWGVSQAVFEDSEIDHGGAPVKYVAGREPTWIPGLVPETYRNPSRHAAPPSVGLAGELPIVIGLMAFSEARDARTQTNGVDRIFLGTQEHRGRWRDRRWAYSKSPAGYPATAQDDPRGFLVSIFLDPENQGCTRDVLERFEWEGVIVRDGADS